MIVLRILVTIALGLACMYFTMLLFAYVVDSLPLPHSYTADLPRDTRVTLLLFANLGQYALAYLATCTACAVILVIINTYHDVLRYAFLFVLTSGAYLIVYTVNASNANLLPGWFFLVQALITLLIPIICMTIFGLIKERLFMSDY